MIITNDENKLQHKYNRHEKKYEMNSGERLVETAGYRRPKDIIDSLVNAGERLADYRRYKYQYERGNNEEVLDKTNIKGYDAIDFSEDVDAISSIVEEAKKVNESSKKDSNKKKSNNDMEKDIEDKEEVEKV